MKDKIKIGLKGFVFGVANIIPGVSGGTIALTMGIYEDLISSISNIRKDFKKSMSLLVPFLIGAVLSILLLSKVINFCLDKYPNPTILLFLGIILGGIPLIGSNIKGKKIKVSYILLFLLTFGLVMGLSFLNGGGNASLNHLGLGSGILLFLVGCVAAASMVMPGISGSFMLMLLGYYHPIIKTIDSLTTFKNLGHDILVLSILAFGVLFGLVVMAKLLEYLFKKYKVATYYAIIGFMAASIVSLVINLPNPGSFIEIIIGIVLFLVGIIGGYRLGDS